MKRITNLTTINSLLMAMFFSFAIVSANAAIDTNTPKVVTAKSYSIAVRHLTSELQKAFNDTSVSFELTNLRQVNANKKSIEIEGEGLAVFDSKNETLPLHFSFFTDQNNAAVSNLNYQFIEADISSMKINSNSAPDQIESVLMREIMNKLHNDYKTTEIVISIDDFQKVDPQTNIYEGSGEVRVGDMIWKQIDFKVKLNDENEKAKNVDYKIVK